MLKRKILIAPGPFKECMSAREAAQAMWLGVRDVAPALETIVRPLSDGGSGIADLLVEATQGRLVSIEVAGPLGEPITATYGILGDGETAIVESAAACGLALVPPQQRNPLRTTTYGVGELILHAVRESNVKTVIVGCGDSATNDCGIGMAHALGVTFIGIDASRRCLAGEDLPRIKGIDVSRLDSHLSGKTVIVACNLTSILTGPEGTSHIYAPQKGASPDQVRELADGALNFSEIVYREMGHDLAYLPGAGGAGGLAASLYAFLDARLVYSFDVVGRYLDLDNLLGQSSLVLTGEGTIDDRTATGKVVCALALRAKRFDLPVIALVGAIGQAHENVYANGIDAVCPIQEAPTPLDVSIERAGLLLRRATARSVRFVRSLANVNESI